MKNEAKCDKYAAVVVWDFSLPKSPVLQDWAQLSLLHKTGA